MPRSSRHESSSSHRPHKHSSREARERSDSEDEGYSRERRSKGEESAAGPAAASASRVSRDPESEKRKGSTTLLLVPQERDVSGSGDGDCSGDRGKKRKERPSDSAAAAERCNGGDEKDKLDDKELKGEEDFERTGTTKALAVDSKGKSSRRHEGSGERKENSVVKDDSAKRRSEKEHSRRESGVHHKDVKERERERGSERDRVQGSERDRERGSDRDRESSVFRGRESLLDKERERGSEKEKKVLDVRQERSGDASTRRQGGTAGSLEEESLNKGDEENTEWQTQDDSQNAELEKELEKSIQKKRDDLRDKDKWHEDSRDGENNVTSPLKNDKWQGEGRDSEEKRPSTRENRIKNGSHKDEKYRDGSYSRDKYREGVDRVQRHQDDKARDDRSSRDHTSERSNSKHYRDEKKSLENHYKRSKHQDSDHDGSSYTDDRGTKYKDGRGRKRLSDENEDHIDVKRNAKEPCTHLEGSTPHNYNVDSSSERDRQEYVHPDKVDFSISRPKSSPCSSAQYSRDQYRHNSKQMESMGGNNLSEERPHMASSGDLVTPIVHERVPEHRSLEKSKPKNERHVNELSIKSVTSSKYERSPRSDGPGSPVQLTDKSPSSASDRRRSNRAAARYSLDIEEMGQGRVSKDGTKFSASEVKEQEQAKEKPGSDDRSQVDMINSYPDPTGLSSFNRTENVSSGFPNHFPPPVRFGIDSPVLGSFDEENRVLLGDRKSGARYKRNVDINMSRGQGHAWKGVQNWPSPVANGFIPFRHLPPGGYHPVVQQFPPPSLFGMRPSMDLSHTGVPYHMHETPDRFSSHARSFGWRNPADDSCPPHLQGWEGNNGIPLDESHVYRRPDWEQSRHLISNRGWEMSVDVWKGQNENNNMEVPVPQKELDYSTHIPPDETRAGQSVRHPCSELAKSPAESIEIKRSCEITSAKDAVEVSPKAAQERSPAPSKPSRDDSAHFCCIYLSRLDISADLVRPELYKQCLGLIGTVDTVQSSSHIAKSFPQGIIRDAKVQRRGSNILSSQFPAVSDTVFQRAMSLYKKQKEDTKMKMPQSFIKADGKDSSAVETVAPMEMASEDVSHVNNNLPINEDYRSSAEAKCISAANPTEQPSDTIPSVVVVEGPEACEVLTPECSLNLSRIHHSPQSTH